LIQEKNMINKKIRIVMAIAATLVSGAASATSFFLNATNPNNAVTLALGAGSYEVSYDGGAWNPWGSVGTCDVNGANCSHGWYNAFFIDNTAYQSTGNFFATQALAEAAAQSFSPISFSLASFANVVFSIKDYPYSDNLGGISLSVNSVAAPVPEPETYAMMLAGLGLLGVFARRKKQKAVA
jgi:hypothetical protein